MKMIFNLFCIVGAFVLGFHAQGTKETEQTQVHLSDGYLPSNMPPSAIVCIGHCDTIERLNEVDRERFLAKARERVAGYETRSKSK